MKKKVLSVVTSPLRLIKRIGKSKKKPASPPSLAKPASGKPARKVPKLKGKPRIAAFVVAGLLLVILVLALRPAGDESDDVAGSLERYADATREKDYQTLCDELLSSALVERIRSAGLPCEVALRTGLEDRQNPTLKVQGVEVSGDQALARVRSTAAGEVPSTDTVRLVKEGDDWRIASLAGPDASSP